MKIDIVIKDHYVNENTIFRKPEIGEVFAHWGSSPVEIHIRVDDWNKDVIFLGLNTDVGIAVMNLNTNNFGWMYPSRCSDGSYDGWDNFEIIPSKLSVYNE